MTLKKRIELIQDLKKTLEKDIEVLENTPDFDRKEEIIEHYKELLENSKIVLDALITTEQEPDYSPEVFD